jgi:hypothetical protein
MSKQVVVGNTYWGKLSKAPVIVDAIQGDEALIIKVGSRKTTPVPLNKFHLRYTEQPRA